MRAFLCSIDEAIWNVVEIGWIRPEAAKSTWDKAFLAASNANSKALNTIFYGVSSDEFHRISHILEHSINIRVGALVLVLISEYDP